MDYEEMDYKISLDNLMKYKNQLFNEMYIPKINEYIKTAEKIIEGKNVLFFYVQNLVSGQLDHEHKELIFIFIMNDNHVLLYYPESNTQKRINISNCRTQLIKIPKTNSIKLIIENNFGDEIVLHNDFWPGTQELIIDDILVNWVKIKESLGKRIIEIEDFLDK
ncbi:hypothetical protein [Sporolactobacillus laevolacticus]|uniref:hypothetical protein n=1 Tax=Sporolactobacillus laevolacticus TaxID=33018 RepID=UPI0025B2EFB4|nr:hypothetical protein [Sporolactobacillus laevolacticus]MDN3956200.1 hypothetical protein [Sporolactobacillus laevolacticus]